MKTNLLKTTAIATILSAVMPLYASATTGDNYISLSGEYVASAKADGDLTSATASATQSADYSDGLGVTVAIGHYVKDNVRIEAEGGYHHLDGDTYSVTLGGTTYTVDASSLDTKALTLMGNAYFDIPTKSKLSPYIGAGVGLAHETEEGENTIAYQLMAGVNYKVSDRGTLFAGYKYLGTGDFEYQYNINGFGQVTDESSVRAHALNVGYRFKF